MAFGMIAIIGTPFLPHRGPSLKVDAQVARAGGYRSVAS